MLALSSSTNDPGLNSICASCFSDCHTIWSTLPKQFRQWHAERKLCVRKLAAHFSRGPSEPSSRLARPIHPVFTHSRFSQSQLYSHLGPDNSLTGGWGKYVLCILGWSAASVASTPPDASSSGIQSCDNPQYLQTFPVPLGEHHLLKTTHQESKPVQDFCDFQSIHRKV